MSTSVERASRSIGEGPLDVAVAQPVGGAAQQLGDLADHDGGLVARLAQRRPRDDRRGHERDGTADQGVGPPQERISRGRAQAPPPRSPGRRPG